MIRKGVKAMDKIILVKSLALAAALSASISFAGGVPADLPPDDLPSASSTSKDGTLKTDAYALDSSGHLVRDNSGNCIRTVLWTSAQALPQCEKSSK